MAWILLEGLDRSGKSTVAAHYKEQGYDVVHMQAPNKKYIQPGYSGESYLEEIVRMYTIYGGKDVVFDRTIYGEEVWPEVYNRMPQLNAEDLEYLAQLEYNNNAVKYVMYDENKEAHWQRCVDNNEPLNRLQFTQARGLYDKLATNHNFIRRQLGDFEEEFKSVVELQEEGTSAGDADTTGTIQQPKGSQSDPVLSSPSRGVSLEEKLERANAIRSLLKSSLVKKKGDVFGKLEQDIKHFLEEELEGIFKEKQKLDFTSEEVKILKLTAQRMKEKLG